MCNFSNEVWCIIPARGGSKGIPNKNIYPLGGKPLLSYSIESALACHEINRVIVSTDSERIALISEKYGAFIPALRPKDISEDNSLISDAYWHGVDSAVEMLSIIPKKILVLYPTSPFRPSYLLEEAIRELDDSIVYKVCQKIEPQRGYFIKDKSGNMRRVHTSGGLKQMGLVFGIRYFPPECRPYSATYPAFLDFLKTMEYKRGGTSIRTLVPYLKPWEVDIDTMEDMKLAEWCIESGFQKSIS